MTQETKDWLNDAVGAAIGKSFTRTLRVSADELSKQKIINKQLKQEVKKLEKELKQYKDLISD